MKTTHQNYLIEPMRHIWSCATAVYYLLLSLLLGLDVLVLQTGSLELRLSNFQLSLKFLNRKRLVRCVCSLDVVYARSLRTRGDGEGRSCLGKQRSTTRRADRVVVIVGDNGSRRTVGGDGVTVRSGAGTNGAIALFGMLVMTLEAARLRTTKTTSRIYSMSVI
jgi:hypothetical protein